jgi:hypothetical protein
MNGDNYLLGESHIQAEKRNCHTQVSENGTSHQGSVSIRTVTVTMVPRVLTVRCNIGCSMMLGVDWAMLRYRA